MPETDPASEGWQSFLPSVAGQGKARDAFLAAFTLVLQAYQAAGLDAASRALHSVLSASDGWPRAAGPGISASLSLAVDLLHQGWRFRLGPEGAQLHRDGAASPDEQRRVRRGQLSLRREEQLREPATQDFVRRMERPVRVVGGRVSVFDLMCDGTTLASRLEQTSGEPVIAPYLQTVSQGTPCEETGLDLQDIWRYFRHGWANAYESIPGRSVQVLVRDASMPRHPVIGILALGSAAIKVRCRDDFIGWEPELACSAVNAESVDRWSDWVQDFLVSKYDEIYRTDLLRDGLIPRRGLLSCSESHAEALRSEAALARETHQANVDTKEFVKGTVAENLQDDDWEAQAQTKLFRSKRCGQLAKLIGIAEVLGLRGGASAIQSRLSSLAEDSAARRAFESLVAYARSATVGTEIADLIVCGAVPPYSEILGGKLAAMLAASPDMVQCYRQRYSASPSIIASSMAGRAIVRDANLVFVGTTSLYGLRPSQYDRAAYPCEIVGGPVGERIAYRFLARTEGFGTSQISQRSQDYLRRYMAQSVGRGPRANNVFGEGANPRMRALRESIEALGLPATSILRHGQSKCVYGVKLARNVRDYLLRLDREPDYLFADGGLGSSDAIARYWYERWVRPRLKGTDLIERVRRHSLARPVRHGARVELPELDTGQLSLFADLDRR